MTFEEILDQAISMLQRRGRVTYKTLQRQFNLDETALEDLKEALLYSSHTIIDDNGRGLIWTGEAEPSASGSPIVSSSIDQERIPSSYPPPHLAERILHSKSALEGERKPVTVLFADIKGSMELIAGLDPEEARQILDPVLHTMMEAVHRYEGTVNQVLGDGIMAFFGAPLAHEDHAVRACYAGLAMQEAMRQQMEEIRRVHGIGIQIWVGMNSGGVVVRAIGNDLHMDYSAIGQTTHLAARMEQLAPPRSFLLTGETLRLVEGLVQVKSLGPIPVKGMVEPMEIFELIGASSIRRQLQAKAARGLTRFVGRQRELDILQQALEKAAAGQGQVVAMLGEPGVGKSRLFYEFVHAHRTYGWLILESSATSYGKAIPYLPVIDLLKSYFQIEERDEKRTIREKVTGKLLTLDPALQSPLPAFLSLFDLPVEDASWEKLDPSQRRQRTQEACKRLFLRESQGQPVLGVLENLHWIDSETQAFLESLIESLPTARVFWSMGKQDRALAVSQRALALATTLGDLDLQVRTNLTLGQAYHALGNYHQAIQSLEENIVLLNAQFPGQMVFSLTWYVWCLAELGAFAEGIAYGEEAVRIAEAINLPYGIVHAYFGIGFVFLRKGDFSQAIVPLEQGLVLCRTVELPNVFLATVAHLGYAYALSGRIAEAIPLLEQIEQGEAIGSDRSLWLSWRSEAYLLAGRMDDAITLAQRALDLSRDRKEQDRQAWILWLLGEIYSHPKLPDTEQAEDYYQQALTLATELGMRPLQAHCHHGLGMLYSKIGQQEQARAELSNAIELYRSMEMTFWLTKAESGLAQVK